MNDGLRGDFYIRRDCRNHRHVALDDEVTWEQDGGEMANCKLCGEPMPEGEEMFYYHGYSCPCPKPPLQKTERDDYVAFLRFVGGTDDPNRHLQLCNSDDAGAFKVYRK